jgi:hypothetical protein
MYAICGTICNRLRHVSVPQSAMKKQLDPPPRQFTLSISLPVQNFLAKNQIRTISQPPCSSDLAPCDFWLFPRLKMDLKGYRFASVEEIRQNATTDLRATPEDDFQRCFQQWLDCWSKCVCAEV